MIATRLHEKTESLELPANSLDSKSATSLNNKSTSPKALAKAKGLCHRQMTGTVFLDVAKAFGRVWHDKAIATLMDSYIRDIKLGFKVEHENLTDKDIDTGVPQGSVSTPKLFNIYTSDIPKTDGTEMFLYASSIAVENKTPIE